MIAVQSFAHVTAFAECALPDPGVVPIDEPARGVAATLVRYWGEDAKMIPPGYVAACAAALVTRIERWRAAKGWDRRRMRKAVIV